MFKGFQKPKRLVANTETLTERYGMFTAQPFERGFGTTIGNALRRILLSSIEGAAITAVRIDKVEQYYISVRGDEQVAQTRLMQTVNSIMREEFGKRSVNDVVSGERDRIMEVLREKADADARKIGVEVLDVRLKRVDFPVEISESVYRRMDAERKRVANELRATGNAESEKIRADADRQREVILANAYREAQKIKGDGDAKATALYASAYGRNSEFYAFYRSMEAYKQSFKNKSDVMVVDPSSSFFKYLKSASKGGK